MSLRSTLATRGRGVMTSEAVWPENSRVRASRVAVSRSSAPWLAERRTRLVSSSAVRAELISSRGSTPTARRITFAVLLSRRTNGRKTAVNPSWKGMTTLATCRGRASARFFGTSSPMIIDSSVAIVTPTMVATIDTADGPRPHAVSSGSSMMLNAGSSVNPVSRVVSVMPSCALDRWVEVTLSARMTGPSIVSPRPWRASSSARSRLTSVNSLATKRPVPMIRTMPIASRTHSFIGAHRPSPTPARVYGRALTAALLKTETGGRP